jgi:opacity protein-like surface antigen
MLPSGEPVCERGQYDRRSTKPEKRSAAVERDPVPFHAEVQGCSAAACIGAGGGATPGRKTTRRSGSVQKPFSATPEESSRVPRMFCQESMRGVAMLRIIGLITAMFLFQAPLLAQDRGWFVSGQLGRADYDTLQKGSSAFQGDTDDEATAWAIGIGYRLHRNLSVRGLYERSDGLDTVNRCRSNVVCPLILIREETDFESGSLVAMPRLWLGSRTNLYGTIGLQYLDADAERILPDDSGIEVLFGGGLEFSLTPRLSIAAELQASAADYRAARFGVSYTF